MEDAKFELSVVQAASCRLQTANCKLRGFHSARASRAIVPSCQPLRDRGSITARSGLETLPSSLLSPDPTIRDPAHRHGKELGALFLQAMIPGDRVARNTVGISILGP